MSKIPATKLKYKTASGGEGEVVIFIGAPEYKTTLAYFNKQQALGHLKIYKREEVELDSSDEGEVL